MEPPPAFRPHAKEGQPLHPLSPERVHNTRPASSLSVTTSMTKTSNTSDTDTAFPPPEPTSTHSSPTRKPAAPLFADYRLAPPSQNTRGFALPQSPSLPDVQMLRGHGRSNSDVQGLVKRFEHLDVRDKEAESADRKRRHEAELKRALIAREEAESDVRRLREEMRQMRRDGEEGREREGKVARRLEVVMDECAHAKATYASQHSIYEKELRKARKESFKSSSAVLKLQEELKSTRNSLRITQSGFELEKQKVQRREQETFEAQYQLAAVQEELDKLRTHLRIVGEEKEALKRSLKEEEVARIAAEGMIALPPPKPEDEDRLMSSPRKSPRKHPFSPMSDDKENMGTDPNKKLYMQTKKLEVELKHEQTRRADAEETMEFLSLECKFQCCSCRSARRKGSNLGFEMSTELAVALASLKQDMMSVLGAPGEAGSNDVQELESMEVDSKSAEQSEVLEEEQVAKVDFEKRAQAEQEREIAQETEEDVTNDDQDRIMTLAPEEAPVPLTIDYEETLAPHPTPAEASTEPEATPQPEPVAEVDAEPFQSTSTAVPLQPSSPQTPLQPLHTTPHRHQNPRSVRTITTTTRIPMHFTPISKPLSFPLEDAENIPPESSSTAIDDTTAPAKDHPFDRAAALAAIEYRRGRARSFATGHVTPRKQMLEGVHPNGRRDISAPALGGKTVGTGASSFVRGPGSVGKATGKAGRVG